MNRLTLLVALALLVAGVLSCSSQAETVRIATEGAYPPYNFVNDSGQLDGFEKELGDELCRRADLECTWTIIQWDTIIARLLEGEHDAIMAGMTITEGRDEFMDFTQPYLPPSPSVYLALAGSGPEVAEGTLAVQSGTIHSDYLAQSGSAYAEHTWPEEVVQAVLDGSTDAAFVDRRFALDSVAEHSDGLAIVGPETLIGKGTGIGLRESDAELRNKLDQALTSMKEDGSLNLLIWKWLGPDAGAF